MRGNILVIDDEKDVFEELKQALPAHNVYYSSDLTGVNDTFTRKKIDLAIIDLNLKGNRNEDRFSGLDYIRKVHARFPTIIIMVISQYRDVHRVEQAIHNGATRYKWKGALDPDTVEFRKEINELVKTKRDLDQFRKVVKTEIWGNSPNTKELKRQLEKVAKSQLSVFIYGEPGVEKVNASNYLHFKSLYYSESRPLIRVDLSQFMPKELMAILSSKPDKGKTNFLKKSRNNLLEVSNIQNIPFTIQKAFWEIIQSRRYLRAVDQLIIQFVFLLDENPQKLIKNGKLYPDLFFGLGHIEIQPLRERKADLLDIIPEWLKVRGYQIDILEKRILNRFLAYDYPGNTQELHRCLEDMLTHHVDCHPIENSWKTSPIRPESLPNYLKTHSSLSDLSSMEKEVAKLELSFIEEALQIHNGHKGEAAKALGKPKTADNLKKSYIDKYKRLFPELIKTFPMIVKVYKLN